MDLGTLSFKQWKPNDLQVTCVRGSFWAPVRVWAVACVTWQWHLELIVEPTLGSGYCRLA